MTGWMVDITIASALMWGAAVASERALLGYRKPVRFVPLLAMLAGPLLPLMVRVWPASVQPVTRMADRFGAGAWLLPDRLAMESAGTGSWWPWVVGSAWLLLSLTMIGVFAVALRRMSRERAEWAPHLVSGVRVLASPSAGPAVVGFRRSSIVVPRWVLALPVKLRRLVVLHEAHHARAGDLRLLLIGAALMMAMPWNLPGWALLRRLRVAIELDCDRRVLRGGVAVGDYARLLLDVKRRLTWPPVPALAMAQPHSTLGRRIDTMTTLSVRWRGARAALAASVALGLVLIACDAVAPDAPDAAADKAVAGAATAGQTGTVSPKVVVRGEPAPDSAAGPVVLLRTPSTSAPDPLYIVDGVIVSDRTLIDPEAMDIETIEVVKGGAAVRLYGSRGRDGVVVITTKK